MESADLGPADGDWALHLDLHVTRRKTFHTIIEPGGAVAYSARYVSEAIAWLDIMDVKAYMLFPNTSHSLGLPLRPIRIERQD